MDDLYSRILDQQVNNLIQSAEDKAEEVKEEVSKEEKKSDKVEEKEEDIKEIKNIEGMSLKYPNFIYERLSKYEPTLFSTKKDGNFNSYSRTCALNMGRQPIILTDKEKKIIDLKHPGSYTHSIKFGTNKKYNYICPDTGVKTNMPLSEKDVQDGVCGGVDSIIPREAKTVPKGKSIYEFNAPKEHIGRTKDGKEYYIHHGPGFLKDQCLPCCFKKWDGPKQLQRNKECQQTNTSHKRKKVKVDDLDEYIKE